MHACQHSEHFHIFMLISKKLYGTTDTYKLAAFFSYYLFLPVLVTCLAGKTVCFEVYTGGIQYSLAKVIQNVAIYINLTFHFCGCCSVNMSDISQAMCI